MGNSVTKAEQLPRFESWGRYPTFNADLVPLHWATDFPLPHPPANKQLPVGLGRSYGDVCLLENGTLLQTAGMDRLLHFDRATGMLRCEAGISLAADSRLRRPPRLLSARHPRNEVRNRRWRHRQRHPRQESPCRWHLWPPCSSFRAGALRRHPLRLQPHRKS